MTSTITKRSCNILVKPEKIQKWLLIEKVKLKAQIAAIKAITKIDEGFAAKEAVLSDTQDLAEELLYAEAHLGEMLEEIPKQGSKYSSVGGTIHTLPEGINKKQSHYAQVLHRNEDIIAQAAKEFLDAELAKYETLNHAEEIFRMFFSSNSQFENCKKNGVWP